MASRFHLVILLLTITVNQWKVTEAAPVYGSDCGYWGCPTATIPCYGYGCTQPTAPPCPGIGCPPTPTPCYGYGCYTPTTPCYGYGCPTPPTTPCYGHGCPTPPTTPRPHPPTGGKKAIVAFIVGNQVSGVHGYLTLTQDTPHSPVHIFGALHGLSPNKQQGFHVHESGDIREGCVSALKHFNPMGVAHMGKESPVRHVGDLGNIQSDFSGNKDLDMWDDKISLYGENSIIGRSFVIHEKEDDLGLKMNDEETKKTGNAGIRVACGIVGVLAPKT